MKSYTIALIILSALSYTQAAVTGFPSSSFSTDNITATTTTTTNSSATETATETGCFVSTTTETVFLPAPTNTFTCVCGPQIPPTVSLSSDFTSVTPAPDSSFTLSSVSETVTISSSVASASESVEESDGTVTVTATGDDDLRRKLARRQDEEDEEDEDCEDDASTTSALSSAIFSSPTLAPPVEPSGVVTCVCGPGVPAAPTTTSVPPTVGIPTEFSSLPAIPSSSLVVSDTNGTVTASETFSVPTDPVSSSIAGI
ncbi:hypothetical protein WG66_001048 [Moniliophthora roreri]|nr:hypothetical protein WG66_001048 [Moniliophthora roreri]